MKTKKQVSQSSSLSDWHDKNIISSDFHCQSRYLKLLGNPYFSHYHLSTITGSVTLSGCSRRLLPGRGDNVGVSGGEELSLEWSPPSCNFSCCPSSLGFGFSDPTTSLRSPRRAVFGPTQNENICRLSSLFINLYRRVVCSV